MTQLLDSILDKQADDLAESDIVYDWNSAVPHAPLFTKSPKLLDETLRDGIQSPSIVEPSLEDRIRLLHLSSAIGIDAINVGQPGAGPRAFEAALRLACEIRDSRLPIRPACVGRTHGDDVKAMLELNQRAGIMVEPNVYLGSSPIRMYAEAWNVRSMVDRSTESLDALAKAGLPVGFVTEDTTRSRPEVLGLLFRAAIEHGAQRIILCDTVGHSTPPGVENLIRFTRTILESMGSSAEIDWHGHNDRGLGVANALAAVHAGADRVHGSSLGIGERVGNAALDQLLVNLFLLGEPKKRDLTRLVEWCRLTAKACHLSIPPNYPVIGEDAFRTATGVHAAAIIKAERRGHRFLADRIYSSVPAAALGKEQVIEVSPLSGEACVVYWLSKREIEPARELVEEIVRLAKSHDRLLTEDEILSVVRRHSR